MNRPGLLLLTASAGATLVAAIAPAAAVTPKDDPTGSTTGYSLSIALAEKSIDPGASDAVSGVLTKAGIPQSGDTVYLRARVNGRRHHGHRVGSAVTGPDGSVSFTVTPIAKTHYRLVFRAASSTSPTTSPTPSPVSRRSTVAARSKVVTVHILRNSSLSIRSREGRRGEVIQGQLRGAGHSLPGRKVTLQERSVGSDTWTPVSTHRTRRHGVVIFRVDPPTAPEEFELSYAGGPNYHGCQSGVVTIG